MNLSIVPYLLATVLTTLLLACRTPAQIAPAPAPPDAAGAATTRAAPSELERPAPAPAKPPRVRFDQLFDVELRDRRLDVTLTPPKVMEADVADGRSVTVQIADADLDNDEWSVAAEPSKPRAANGGHRFFGVAPPASRTPDRWSPLQLVAVTAGDELYFCGMGRVNRTFVTVHFRQDQQLRKTQLTVQRSRRMGVGRPLHDFTAADPLELWNDHQREMRLYVLPLLKRMAGQDLLRPRAGDVYRAFETIPADPAMVERVQRILPELEADAPADRDAASAKLEALGPAGVLAMCRIDRAALAPEPATRVDAVVARQSTLREPAQWRRDIYFLTDCLNHEDAAVRRAALAAASGVAGRALSFDVEADALTRAAAAEDVLRTLEELVAAPPLVR